MRRQLLQATSRLAALAKSGDISSARKVFDEMLHRDTVSWNAMVSGYTHQGFHQEALSLFSALGFSDVKPDHFTYTAALSACAGLKCIISGRKIHSLVVISGWNSVLPVNNALVDMYGKCFSAEEANGVFKEMALKNEVSWCSMLFAWLNVGLLDVSFDVFCDMPRRVVVSWNTIIAGYAKWGEVEMCLDLFKKMLEDSCRPDQWTLSSIMNACAGMRKSCFGHMMHGLIIVSGWNTAAEVHNAILSFYVKFGDKNEVLRAVATVGVRNEVYWNVTIDAYMKIGNLEEACRAFQCLPEKNFIAWTSMITGYMRNGYGECALKYFVRLMQSGIRPDDIALGAVLHACSIMATLGHGRMVHDCVVKTGFHSYTYVGNGLVNMYAKCGNIHDSHRAFGDILEKDLVSWNTMLFGFGLHGRSTQALFILDEMMASGMNPDKVTFVGILMTCSHLGLIDEGLSFFESMAFHYGISPDIDHVACVVDMLGRGGKLEKAIEVANNYIEANNVEELSSMEALLGSYCFQGNLTMGAEIAEQLQILKPNDEMNYMLLANMYCACGQWKQAQTLRKAMVDGGVKKIPGCSWIEVTNQATAFVAGSNSFPYAQEVRPMLQILEYEARYPTSVFLMDGVT